MRTLLMCLLIVPTTAFAQYKCTINGKTQYSDQPCAANARYVGALEDSVSERARIDAELLRRKDKVQRNNIDRRDDQAFQSQQRALEQQVAAEQAHQAAAERDRARRCSNLSNEMKWNQRGVARYQDFGWQRSLTQEEQDLKRNREAYERECR